MLGHIYIIIFSVWTAVVVKGLFLDQMMTDCHGLPFACMLKTQNQAKLSQSQSLNNNLNQNAKSNTLATTLFRQESTSISDGGYNPSDMSSVVKQNMNMFGGSGQSNGVSGNMNGQANLMGNGEQNSGIFGNTASSNGGYSQQNNILESGRLSNQPTNNDQYYRSGESGSINTGQGMSSNFVGGSMSNPMTQNGMPNFGGGSMGSHGSVGHGGGGTAGPSFLNPNNMRNGGLSMASQETMTEHLNSDKSDNLKDILLQVVGNMCGVDWINCPKNCFIINKVTGCPTCTCQKNNVRPTDRNGNQIQPGRGQCAPFEENCPKACVTFDDNGCTVCSCDASPCPLFPGNCPRGFSRIDENGCPVCTMNDSMRPDSTVPQRHRSDENDNRLSWYDKIWRP